MPPVTTPAVVVPSPQLIVAVKSAAVFAVSVSLKAATVPLNWRPSVALKAGALCESCQFWMSWTADRPPVPPVKPTKPVLPTVPERSTLKEINGVSGLMLLWLTKTFRVWVTLS